MSHTITRNLVILTTILASFAAQATIYAEMRTAADGSTFESTSPTKEYACYFVTLNTMKSNKVMNDSTLKISDVDKVVSFLLYDFNTNIKKISQNGKTITMKWYNSEKAMEAYTTDGSYSAGSTFVVYTYTPSTGGKASFRVASWNVSGTSTIKDWTASGIWRAWTSTAPTGAGGYVCGYKDGTKGYMPTTTSGDSEYVKDSNGMFYIYLGTAVIRDDGVIDFSRLTYITNAVPKQDGCGAFGNYDKYLAEDQVWQDDRIDPNSEQDYTILLVSKANGQETPPDLPPQLYDYQTNMYVAVYTGNGVSHLTKDRWQYVEITVNRPIVVADYNNGTLGTASPLAPIVFYNHIEYSNPSLATLNIPKSYIVSYLGADKTDEELMAGSLLKWDNGPYSLMEAYVLGKDPTTKTDLPTVLPVQTSSASTLQLNVGNVTVNEKANADVKYGLVSSASPEFTDPTVVIDPQSSPELTDIALPASGVQYYRANLTIQGK